MTSWMKERDRLVEQTLAFVRGVAAQRPVAQRPCEATIAVPTIPASFAVAEIPAPVASDAAITRQDVPKSEVNPASAETDALISLMALTQPALPGDENAFPAEPIAMQPIAMQPVATLEALPAVRTVATPAFSKPAFSKPPLPKAQYKRPIEMALPERDIIAQRVASFRAGQQKFIRDLDDNYALVQAKIRATLGNDPAAR